VLTKADQEKLATSNRERDTERAMSEENVEIVRGIIDAHERGDFYPVFAKYDPEIEWHIDRVTTTLASDLDPVYYGHDGIRAFWRAWFAAWERADFEYQEFIDAGDTVVTILSQRMQGRTSGIEFTWDSYGQVWTLRNDKIVRVEFFPSRDEALEAAGLRE
jgi:ketosteroid isomerase-like protein